MSASAPTLTPRQSALTAGISLLLIAVAAGFAYGYVHGNLIIPDDLSATVANLRASEFLFRFSIGVWLMILLLDVVAAWALYRYLAPVHQDLSLLTAWLRVVYAVFLAIAIIAYMVVLLLLQKPIDETGAVSEQIGLFLGAFSKAWSVGLIIFGAHLLLLGFLVWRSGFVPKWLAVLIVIAAFSYLLVHKGFLFFPDVAAVAKVESILAIPMAIGELAFAVWLVVKGGKA
ncbi:MAG: DUF4386 domain-containing protein [Lewinella sp.]|nr:DUF4386 domain-containing protein [Lewinella sp.]